MIEIVPAILAKTKDELLDKFTAFPRGAQSAHIDFVESGLIPEAGDGKLRVPIREAHLMLPHPQEHITALVKAGFQRIVVQVEALSPEMFAELVHEWRHAADMVPSLKIDTPLSAIDSFAHELSSVQLMGIAHIGAQGRLFDERVIPRIRALHAKYPRLTIAIDGGVNKENAESLADAGASRLIVGSAMREFYG
ncbi:MAG: hypothetical protein AAB767_04750 [Patescibacteria group bacterium]